MVRHADAGDPHEWSGDDRLRPLSAAGRRQAAALAALLATRGARRVLASPYRRCEQTVEPLARALGVTVERSADLATGAGLRALDCARSAGAGAVLCTHGDVAVDVVGALSRQGLGGAAAASEKASTWVLELEGEEVVGVRYLPPPA